jgi:hypothetical protein
MRRIFLIVRCIISIMRRIITIVRRIFVIVRRIFVIMRRIFPIVRRTNLFVQRIIFNIFCTNIKKHRIETKMQCFSRDFFRLGLDDFDRCFNKIWF